MRAFKPPELLKSLRRPIPSASNPARPLAVAATAPQSAPPVLFTSRRKISTKSPSRRSCSTPFFAVPPRPTSTLSARATFASTASSQQAAALANRRTPLYDFHIKYGGKMVEFGGWDMPLLYEKGEQALSHSESHKWVREKAGLFDVSHMLQHRLSGPGAQSFLMRVTPSDIPALKPNTSTLSCLLESKTGGIVDDTVITFLGNGEFYFVTNAACRDDDISFLSSELRKHLSDGGEEVTWQILPPALLALQGPRAAEVLAPLLSLSNPDESRDLSTLYFGQSRSLELTILTPPVLISRTGYTGEDGFEISIPSPLYHSPSPNPASSSPITPTEINFDARELQLQTSLLAESLLSNPLVRLAGLAARDSLRLEAGMCLYGHDINLETTPVVAGLSWIIPQSRRSAPASNFNGSPTIISQLRPKKEGGIPPAYRRVGLLVEKGAPVREGASVVDLESEKVVGRVTSGGPSVSLGQNIAMALVGNGFHKRGTELGAVVRGKVRKCEVVRMPFVDAKFYRPV